MLNSNLEKLQVENVHVITGVTITRFGPMRIMTVTNATASAGRIGALEESDYPTINIRQPMSYNLAARTLGTLGINTDGSIIAYNNSGADLTTTASINGLAIWSIK